MTSRKLAKSVVLICDAFWVLLIIPFTVIGLVAVSPFILMDSIRHFADTGVWKWKWL